MSKPKPLGIRSTLWLAIALTLASTLLGAGALHSYQLYCRADEAETLRARALATAYAAQAAAWLGVSREELGQRIDQLPLHRDVLLLAVVTELHGGATSAAASNPVEPQVFKVRGDGRLLNQFLQSPEARADGVKRLNIGARAGIHESWPNLYLVTAPIASSGSNHPVATLVCGVRSANRYILTPREVGILFARLLVMACAAGTMGFYWLKRSVLAPLAALAERSSDGKSPQGLNGLHADREDEIGSLARVLSEMHMSLEEWRERAVRLERNVNRRVASETRRVNRELQQAQRKIWTDPLTQLGNRRLLEDRLEEIFTGQRADGDDLSIVMIDVDNFKTLNDGSGHQAGDEVLKFIGDLLKHSLREQDLAIRYGGDEFVLILPSVTLGDARRIAQRTILLFNQQAKLLSVKPRPSLSAGVASLWEQKPETANDLLQLADAALYDAKRAGKSCVREARPAELALKREHIGAE